MVHKTGKSNKLSTIQKKALVFIKCIKAALGKFMVTTKMLIFTIRINKQAKTTENKM